MKRFNINTIQWGFSDIRMWPCYMILCILTLVFNKWLGLFWSTVLVGLPAFYVSLRLFKLHDPSKAPVKQEDVYAEIQRSVKEHEENNYLLRRNMKIIESDKYVAKTDNKQKTSKNVHFI